MRVDLLIVDPQNDFCVADDGHGNRGALVVPGADQDMARVAALIRRIGHKLNDIHVTLDSHHEVAIERPAWWKRIGDGAHPEPFTILGIHPDGKRIVKFNADAAGLHPTDEEYTTAMPSFLHQGGPTGKGSFGYLQALAANGRYPHVVWPMHCLIGDWGHNVVPELRQALKEWCLQGPGTVEYVTKGSNPWTEHFSGVKAEVPDPTDPTTQINTGLIQSLEEADIIAVTGEALSHCVASTVTDVGSCFSDPKYIKKLVLLTDASSNVAGFEFLGDQFIQEMTAKGMQLSDSVSFLA